MQREPDDLSMPPEPAAPAVEIPVAPPQADGQGLSSLPPPVFLPGLPVRLSRWQALAEIVLVSGLLTDTVLGFLLLLILGRDAEQIMHRPALLFIYLMASSASILGLVFVCQRLHPHEPELKLKFTPPAGWARELLLSLGLVPLWLFLMVGLGALIAFFRPDLMLPENPVLAMIKTPFDFALFIMTGIIAGGLREEVQRSFIIRRMEVAFGQPWFGLFGWSVLFGLSHYTQGAAATIVTGFLGLGFGLVFLWRRSLVAPVVTHALFNITVLLIDWIRKGA